MAWKKLLWVRQPYPDNYVDATFLSQLKRNTSIKQHKYWTIVSDWSLLMVNMALTVIFCGVFMSLYTATWKPEVVSSLSLGVTLLLGFKWSQTAQNRDEVVAAVKSAVLITITIMTLAPVFLSLTRSTSSDSIWSLSTWLCLCNLVFASRPWNPTRYVLIISTNTSLCATIVLASRLDTSDAVFHFVLFSVQTYVLLPSVARWLKATEPRNYAFFFMAVVLVSDYVACACFGRLVLLLWQVPQVLVLCGFPGLFLLLQRYKDQIEGPWDPAKPLINQ